MKHRTMNMNVLKNPPPIPAAVQGVGRTICLAFNAGEKEEGEDAWSEDIFLPKLPSYSLHVMEVSFPGNG